MDIFVLGEQCRVARLHRRMSQRRVAAEAGISVAWLARFEGQASMEPSLHRVLRVLHALGLDLRLTVHAPRPVFEDIRQQREDEDASEVYRVLSWSS